MGPGWIEREGYTLWYTASLLCYVTCLVLRGSVYTYDLLVLLQSNMIHKAFLMPTVVFVGNRKPSQTQLVSPARGLYFTDAISLI